MLPRILIALLVLLSLADGAEEPAPVKTPPTAPAILSLEDVTVNALAFADSVNEGLPLSEAVKAAITHWFVDEQQAPDAYRRSEAQFVDATAALGGHPKLEFLGRRELGSCYCGVWFLVKGEAFALPLVIQYYRQARGWRITDIQFGKSAGEGYLDFAVTRKAADLPEAKALKLGEQAAPQPVQP